MYQNKPALFPWPNGDVALGVKENANADLEPHLTLVGEIGD